MKLSPQYTDAQWKAAFGGHEDWKTAIDILKDRIEGRWLTWADQILDAQYSGFAVLALDCIVLESIWGFMNGKSIPRKHEQQVYREMLAHPRLGWNDTESDSFREFVRNGLMHDAETRNQWIVEQTIPTNSIIEKRTSGGYVINRTMFHQALKATFEDWIAQLRAGSDVALLRNMRDRMNQIIAKHYAA
jgi:hypothetical protein